MRILQMTSKPDILELEHMAARAPSDTVFIWPEGDLWVGYQVVGGIVKLFGHSISRERLILKIDTGCFLQTLKYKNNTVKLINVLTVPNGFYANIIYSDGRVESVPAVDLEHTDAEGFTNETVQAVSA